jgi:uncharacterized membrane protein YkvA (DUF1232 family)
VEIEGEKMKEFISEEKAKELLEQNQDEAKALISDEDKMERFLQRLEKKLKIVPVVGTKLSDIPIMASLVRSYVKKEYTDVPIGTIIALVSALIYFVSPIDVIPDSIPVLGYFDDAAVVALCWKFVQSDVEEYLKWRDENGKTIE